jgi:transcriptional regulator with XRE-family HTH domain
MYLADNLRFYRHLRDWSQQALADRANRALPRSTRLSQAHISAFEHGLEPSGPVIIDALAAALDITTADLLQAPRIARRLRRERPIILRKSVPASA